MRVWLAIKCFFKLLFNADFASQVRPLVAEEPTLAKLDKPVSDEPASKGPAKAAPAPKEKATPKSQRSDAIALLAVLQREARFVDIVSESLEGYSDAQIGAAARDVLRDSGKVLERLFALQPVVAAEEGTKTEVPANYDTGKYRLTGNVAGEAPFSGELMHAGWRATRCELPAWSGSNESALVIAAAEVQIS